MRDETVETIATHQTAVTIALQMIISRLEQADVFAPGEFHEMLNSVAQKLQQDEERRQVGRLLEDMSVAFIRHNS